MIIDEHTDTCVTVNLIIVFIILVRSFHFSAIFCQYEDPLISLKYAGDRSFQKATPMLYNALSVTIQTAYSLAVFKKWLNNTYLQCVIIINMINIKSYCQQTI